MKKKITNQAKNKEIYLSKSKKQNPIVEKTKKETKIKSK